MASCFSTKRKSLSIEEKVHVIRACGNRLKKADLHRTFGLVNSTIGTKKTFEEDGEKLRKLENANKLMWIQLF